MAGPSAGRVAGLPARLPCAARSAKLDWAAATEREQPLVVRPVKGAYWDQEVVEARQHGWRPPGVRAQGRPRSQLRAAHPPPARRAPACPGQGRLAQPALGRPRDRLQPPAGRRRRPRAPGAAWPWRRARRGPARRALAGALVLALSASSSPGWPTWCGGCSRTPRTTRSCAPMPTRPVEELPRRRERETPGMSFANEPTLELRRSDAREALLAALAELDGRLPLRVPMLIGTRSGRALSSSNQPTRGHRHAWSPLPRWPASRTSPRRSTPPRAGFRDWGARPAAERAGVAEGGRGRPAPAAARACGPRGTRVCEAVAGRRRRRLRGDRLPRVLRRLGRRARAGPGAAAGPG